MHLDFVRPRKMAVQFLVEHPIEPAAFKQLWFYLKTDNRYLIFLVTLLLINLIFNLTI